MIDTCTTRVERRTPSRREQVDALDEQIIRLIQRRIEISRAGIGDRRLDLSCENEVIDRYSSALGRLGTALALALVAQDR